MTTTAHAEPGTARPSYADDPKRRGIANKNLRESDAMGWEIWAAMVELDVLRLAEEADTSVPAGSLARQAGGLSKVLHQRRWRIEHGRRLVDLLAAHFEPARAAQGSAWAPPTMAALAEQLNILRDAEAGTTTRKRTPAPPRHAPPAAATTTSTGPPPSVLPPVNALAGHTREQLDQIAGFIEARRLLAAVRLAPTQHNVDALAACQVGTDEFAEGTRWALQPHAEEIDRIEPLHSPVAITADDTVKNVTTKADEYYRIEPVPNGAGFNHAFALHQLASGKVRCASRASPPSAATSGAMQHVVLAYLITRADAVGRIAISGKALDEALGIGRVVAGRSLKALSLAGLLDVEERPRMAWIYTVKLAGPAAANAEQTP